MTFNIDEVLSEMLTAVKGEVKEDWKIVKGTANNFLQSRKWRLELLASLRLQNQISEIFFKERLVDEKNILESELHAIAIISKITAQNAANAAMGVLQKTIDTVLGVL
ncbi:MAG: hypothetical protein ABIY51_15405 [Ferruginibacter sp.]